MIKLFHIKILVSLIVLSVLSVEAQVSDEAIQHFNKAERLLQAGNYSDAINLYKLILVEEPENPNVNFRVGQCYMNLLGQERNALPHLQKAVKNIDPDYKDGVEKNQAASPFSLLLLGDAYMREEMLDEASKAYHEYKSYVGDDKKELEVVSNRIMTLGVSQGEVRDHPRDVVLSNLGDKINSKSSDYNIIYSGDLKTSVFTRYEKRMDIIFASYFKNGAWTEPVDISDQIGSQGDMYATALSYDGKELFLVLLTPYDADLYVSEFENGEWRFSENLGRNINSKYVESNASLSADGTTLYFSSDRASSMGGFDIYYTQRENGKWLKPENMGEIINSKDNEESPHITESGALYFSSDRQGSIGRLDIYFSRPLDGSWSLPENLGMPYNSVEDEISFKYYEQYRKGYIARDLPGGFGKLDLYLIQSGSDRQRELSDYMSSLKPKTPTAPIEEEVDTVLVAEVVEQEEVDETELNSSNELPEPEVPVVAVVAAPVVAAAIVIEEEPKKDEPVVVEEVSEPEKNIEEPIAEAEIPPTPEEEVIIAPIVEDPTPVSQSTEILGEGTYTIQILALIHPRRQANFNGLNHAMITSFDGDDGFARYIYGRYKSKKEAIKDIKKVFNAGYNDAFIRKTTEISNFH